MKTLNVNGQFCYDIHIENGLIDNCGQLIKNVARGKNALIITDSNVAPLYMERVSSELSTNGFNVSSFIFEAGEQNKTLSTVEQMLGAMCEFGLTRTDFVVALGGGVCGDLAGFASAIYQRGIDYIGIPTTLLSQIDSSVGGKTACDLKFGKNLAGSFHAPKLVIIDPDCLETLSEKYVCDGLAEAVKYGVIKSPSLFEKLLHSEAKSFINDLIFECVSIKRDVTCNDFYDNGERIILNFGHTMGHAIEKYYNFKGMSHGEAVGVGMVIITNAAERAGLCEKGLCEKIIACLHNNGLPTTTAIDIKILCDNALNDKKCSGNRINLVIPKKLGEAEVYSIATDSLYSFLRNDENK